MMNEPMNNPMTCPHFNTQVIMENDFVRIESCPMCGSNVTHHKDQDGNEIHTSTRNNITGESHNENFTYTYPGQDMGKLYFQGFIIAAIIFFILLLLGAV